MNIELDYPTFLHRTTDTVPCTQDPDLFHAPGDSNAAAAADLCFDCPLMLACRDWARAHREHGVWGGETEPERAAAGAAPDPRPGETGTGCGTAAGAQRHRRSGQLVCGPCLDAEHAAHLARRREQRQREATQWPPHLRPRELEVLRGLAANLNRNQVALRLGIKRRTVDALFYELKRKLRTDGDGLVSVGRGLGFLPPTVQRFAPAA